MKRVETNRENVRVAAAIGVRELSLVIQSEVTDHPEVVAEGTGLVIWKYQYNEMVERQRTIPKLQLFESQNSDQWLRGLFIELAYVQFAQSVVFMKIEIKIKIGSLEVLITIKFKWLSIINAINLWRHSQYNRNKYK